MTEAQVWFIFQDIYGDYSVSKDSTGGVLAAEPLLWDGAVDWMREHCVADWQARAVLIDRENGGLAPARLARSKSSSNQKTAVPWALGPGTAVLQSKSKNWSAADLLEGNAPLHVQGHRVVGL